MVTLDGGDNRDRAGAKWGWRGMAITAVRSPQTAGGGNGIVVLSWKAKA